MKYLKTISNIFKNLCYTSFHAVLQTTQRHSFACSNIIVTKNTILASQRFAFFFALLCLDSYERKGTFVRHWAYKNQLILQE